MSADRLAEIKARAEAATPGPWVRDMHSPDMGGRSGLDRGELPADGVFTVTQPTTHESEEDADA